MKHRLEHGKVVAATNVAKWNTGLTLFYKLEKYPVIGSDLQLRKLLLTIKIFLAILMIISLLIFKPKRLKTVFEIQQITY